MLPHLFERPATRKRWPDGVGPARAARRRSSSSPRTWAPGRRTGWCGATIAHRDHDNYYPVVNDLATLTWLAQLAALEIHVPQWRFGRTASRGTPTGWCSTSTPAPGVSLTDCAEIALLARDILRDIGHDPVPVTSGQQGHPPVRPARRRRRRSRPPTVARELARALEADHPDRVISSMKRSERDGKVFLDWSQNNGSKTTISPYSLRGRDRPMVAAPRTWEEMDDPDLRQLDYTEVLERIASQPDPMAPLADPEAPGTPDRLTTYRSMRDAAQDPGAGAGRARCARTPRASAS